MAPPGPGPLLLLALPVGGVEKGFIHVTLAAMCSSHELQESEPWLSLAQPSSSS